MPSCSPHSRPSLIYLDDFVQNVKTLPDQRRVGSPAMSAEALKEMEDALAKVGRPMEVWATIYTREFNRDMPNFIDCEPPLVESMKPATYNSSSMA